MTPVTDAINQTPEPHKSAVQVVANAVRRLVPEAEEGMSYGMPAFRYHGRPLIATAVAAHHIGLYPFSPPIIEALSHELAGFDLSKGTIRFTPDHQLPVAVIEKIILMRREQIDG